MSWARNTSASEKLMVDVLRDADQALTLDEIVKQILDRSPVALSGKTPKNSLYSVIYRRENRRKERGQPALFKTIIRGGARYYSINPKGLESIGLKSQEFLAYISTVAIGSLTKHWIETSSHSPSRWACDVGGAELIEVSCHSHLNFSWLPRKQVTMRNSSANGTPRYDGACGLVPG